MHYLVWIFKDFVNDIHLYHCLNMTQSSASVKASNAFKEMDEAIASVKTA